MGKNIKSYATTQVHFPREREGSLTAKGPNLSFTIWYNLTVHIIRFSNYMQNFQNCLPQAKFQLITQIPRSSPPQSTNSAKFAHFTLCFRHLPRQRTLQFPANYANSTQFAHTVSESCEIRTFC